MAKPKLKTVPTFATEDQEREFWATADSTKYVDWSKARAVTFPNLKLSTTHTVKPRKAKTRLRKSSKAR